MAAALGRICILYTVMPRISARALIKFLNLLGGAYLMGALIYKEGTINDWYSWYNYCLKKFPTIKSEEKETALLVLA